MALVWIVYAPTADRLGPDVDRMNRVEDMPDEVARLWFADGGGRPPTADEVAEYERRQAVEAEADEVLADDGDLTKLLKADLEQMAAGLGVEVPAGATKAVLAEAIAAHHANQANTATGQPSERQ